MSEVRNQVFVVFGLLSFFVAQLENWALESLINMVCKGISCQDIITQADVLWDLLGVLDLHPGLGGDDGEAVCEQDKCKEAEKIS